MIDVKKFAAKYGTVLQCWEDDAFEIRKFNECIALRREYINGYFVTIALFSFTGVLLTFGGCAVKFSGRAFALNKVLPLADGSLWQATQFE